MNEKEKGCPGQNREIDRKQNKDKWEIKLLSTLCLTLIEKIRLGIIFFPLEVVLIVSLFVRVYA